MRLAALAFVGNHRLLAVWHHRRGRFSKLMPAALVGTDWRLQVRRAASVGLGGGEGRRLASCNPAVTDKADAVGYMFRHRGAKKGSRK